MRTAAKVALALLLLCARPGAAAEADSKLEAGDALAALQKQIQEAARQRAFLERQARGLAAELADLQNQAVEAARAVQETEARLSTLEAQSKALDASHATQEAELAARREKLGDTMAALARLSSQPPALLMLAPESPLDSARSGMLLAGLAPRLQADLEALAKAMAAVTKTRGEIAAKRRELIDHQKQLAAQQETLAALTVQRRALASEAVGAEKNAAEHLASLTTEARNIKDLIDRLDRNERESEARATAEVQARAEREAAERDALAAAAARAQAQVAAEPQVPSEPAPAPVREAPVVVAAPAQPAPVQTAVVTPPVRQVPHGRLQLQLPVVGTITQGFGEASEYSTSKGITLAARAGAEVVSPGEGKVEFAGPFKGYGQILIIDHGDGYHSLLAGLDRVDAVVGSRVVSGEPVGTMRTDGTPNLYLELRRQGQPVDPGPWLVSRESKAGG